MNPSSLYLGRVVGVGVTKKGENAVVYGVSGRSEGSRQRKLVIEGDDTIRMASLTDPTPEQLEKSDIFFYPAIRLGESGTGCCYRSSGYQKEWFVETGCEESA